MTDQPEPINFASLIAQLEALLFVAPGSISLSQLSTVLEMPSPEIEKGLLALDARYQESGLRLQRHQNRVLLTTAPECAAMVERFLGLEASSRLSRAALEALAIVAYQQPITRPEVDAIRGVNSDGVIKNLLSKGLIQEVGRAERPGRPILYSTTPDFLQHFGLNTLAEMPPLNTPGEDGDDDVPDSVELLKT